MRAPLSPPWSLGALTLLASLASCDSFESAPEIALIGLKDGRLADPKAPLDVAFSKPVDPASLHAKVVRLVTDKEGNIEGDPEVTPGTVTPLLFEHTATAATGGVSTLLDNNTRLHIEIDPEAPLPVGPSLALVIEPGLRDLAGHDTRVRRRIPFGYGFACKGNTPPGPFVSGQYFFLVNVTRPLGLQVQLIADIQVDPATGAFRSRFTNADRLADPNRCPTPCKSSEVCKLIPAAECVIPSQKAASLDEAPDFYANNSPPYGFSFAAQGCAEQQPTGTVSFGNTPVDAQLTQPKLTIREIVLTGSFAPQGTQLEGSGTFTASEVLLGTIPSGPGEGTFIARHLPPGQTLPDVPPP